MEIGEESERKRATWVGGGGWIRQGNLIEQTKILFIQVGSGRYPPMDTDRNQPEEVTGIKQIKPTLGSFSNSKTV